MRKLSGKTINSLALCVALAAPLVYLFGTLFMTLAGAHGEKPLTNDEVSSKVINFTGFEKRAISPEGVESSNSMVLTSTYEPIYTYPFNYEITGTYTAIIFSFYQEDYTWISRPTIIVFNSFEERTYSGTYTPPQNAAYMRLMLNYGDVIVNSATVKWTSNEDPTLDNLTYNDYLFGQFFTKDNFLAHSGREVLNGTPLYGFEPIGELIRYTDENMLHLANLSYGPLVIGYTYYCAHVIIVDLIFYIGSFIPRLIKKTINKLEGGLD